MNKIQIRDIVIGEGKPKICVPIVGRTRNEIISEAREIMLLPADVVEWRGDLFAGGCHGKEVQTILKELREILREKPILYTYRTKKEGGEGTLLSEEYASWIRVVSDMEEVDLLDIEVFQENMEVEKLFKDVHKRNVKVIGSYHNFSYTPPKDEMIRRLCTMQDKGADIVKMAVMPNNRQDVLTLMLATEEMYEMYATSPLVTMAMGRLGVMSRVLCEGFSCGMTFGFAGKASAPGQIPAVELEKVLDRMHELL